MHRFKIVYNVGKNLKLEEINIDNASEVKIRDSKGELPDLIVKDEIVARKYIEYFNTDKSIDFEVDKYIKGIKTDFNKYVDINIELIKPTMSEYMDENSGEILSTMKLTDRLFYEGYLNQVNHTKSNINGKLSALKNLLIKY